MGGLGNPGDTELARLARRQYGVVALPQCRALGVGEDAVWSRVRKGRLHRIHRGVYAVGHSVLTTEGRWMGAVLACGPGAVLSHRDAAMLHGLRRTSRRDIDVTTSRGRKGHPGITLHRVRSLHQDDWVVESGIPATSIARTQLDCAEVLPYNQLQRLVEETDRQHKFDLRAVDELAMRSRGRRGLKPLMSVIADLRRYVPMTRSELERAFLDLLRSGGIPQPSANLWVEGYEVDAVWLDHKVVVELDGAGYHGTTAARIKDPIRDARLQLAGYRMLRVSDTWLSADPHGVVEATRSLLRA